MPDGPKVVGVNLGPGPDFPQDPLPPGLALRFSVGAHSSFTSDPLPDATVRYPPASRPWMAIFPKRAIAARNPSWTLADFTEVFTPWLAALPEAVNLVEIFNEAALNAGGAPGLLKEKGGAGYAEVLAEASRIVKAQRPGTRILGFGGLLIFRWDFMRAFDAGDYTSSPEYRFAQQAMAAGAASYCDAISVHAYAVGIYRLGDRVRYGPRPNAPTTRATVREMWAHSMTAYAQLAGKPIWVTEVGTPANTWRPDAPNSPEFQAAFLDEALEFFLSNPNCPGVLWWNLAGLSNEGRDYGLLDERRQPRPAFGRLERWAAAGGPPPR